MAIPDTSKARRNILERIRTGQKRTRGATADERDGMARYLDDHPRGPGPKPYPDVLERFCARAADMSSSVSVVDQWSAVPPAVASFLTAHKLAPRAVLAGAVAELDWAGVGLATEVRAPVDADLIAISRAFCGVAETGTLVFLSEPATPATLNLLPETHIAIVARSRLLSTMEDAFDLIRAEKGKLPRATNFISGPSRTGDIEQTIVLGAHGPRAVHIVIVRAA